MLPNEQYVETYSSIDLKDTPIVNEIIENTNSNPLLDEIVNENVDEEEEN